MKRNHNEPSRPGHGRGGAGSNALCFAGVVLASALALAGCSVAGAAPQEPVTSASPAQPTGAPPGAIGAGNGAGLLFAVSAAGDGTVVRGFDRASHLLVRALPLTGHYAFPLVATSGPLEGVSQDGRVLILTASGPPGTSRFAVLDGSLTGPARVVELPARFAYDALSPDGSKLYLVEHLSPAGSEHYQVRSYDLAAGQLDDGVIADKTRIAEWMAGHPTSRATSTDGTIVATMYERHGAAPFIHLLHAADGFAQCVDLPAPARDWPLAWVGPTLTLQDATGRTRLAVDPATGTVTPTH